MPFAVGALCVLLLLASCGGSSNKNSDPTATSIPGEITASAGASPAAGGQAIAIDRADLARSGIYASSLPPTQPAIKWQSNLGSALRFSPVVANGIVYAAGSQLTALDAATGTSRWTAAIAAGGAPTIAGEMLYIGGVSNGQPGLFALDASTGALRWQIATACSQGDPGKDCIFGSSPLVVNGLVIFGDPKNLVAVDAGTGTQKWQFKTGSALTAAAAASGIVVAAAGDHVYGVDPTSGTQKWDIKLDDQAFQPAISHDLVIVNSAGDHVTALKISDGSVAWRRTLIGTPTQPATLSDLLIFGSGNENRLTALKASDGTQLWQISPTDPVVGSPSNAGGTIIYTAGKNVIAYDGISGKELWHLGIDDASNAPVVVANSIVYIACQNGTLIALG